MHGPVSLAHCIFQLTCGNVMTSYCINFAKKWLSDEFDCVVTTHIARLFVTFEASGVIKK